MTKRKNKTLLRTIENINYSEFDHYLFDFLYKDFDFNKWEDINKLSDFFNNKHSELIENMKNKRACLYIMSDVYSRLIIEILEHLKKQVENEKYYF